MLAKDIMATNVITVPSTMPVLKAGKVMDILESNHVGVKAMHTIASPEAASRDLVIHLDVEDAGKVAAEIKQIGFHMDEREHRPWAV